MKFKKCGPEHEAPYLFEVDKKWMRSGNDFSELLESIRKEAYLKGFRRGQEEASYGFWNSDCRKKFREDEETDVACVVLNCVYWRQPVTHTNMVSL